VTPVSPRSCLPGSLGAGAKLRSRCPFAALIAWSYRAGGFPRYGAGREDYAHAEYGDFLVAYYTSGFQTSVRYVRSTSTLRRGSISSRPLAARFALHAVRDTAASWALVVGLIGLITAWRIGRTHKRAARRMLASCCSLPCPLYVRLQLHGHERTGPFCNRDVGSCLLGSCGRLESYPRVSFNDWAARCLLGFGLS